MVIFSYWIINILKKHKFYILVKALLLFTFKRWIVIYLFFHVGRLATGSFFAFK